MKKLKASSGAKLTAAVLFVLLAVAALYCTIGAVYIYDCKGYSGKSLEDIVNSQGLIYVENNMFNLMENYRYGADPESMDNRTGMTFRIYDDNDKLVYDGLGKQSYRVKTEKYGFWYPAYDVLEDNDELLEQELVDDYTIGIKQTKNTQRYKMVGYVLEDIENNEELLPKLTFLKQCYIYRYELLIVMASALVLCLALFAYLMAASGHRADSPEIDPRWVDRVPFDLFTFIALFVGCLFLALLLDVYFSDIVIALAGYGIGAAGIAAIGLWWCMSLAVRLKRHETIKGCITYKVLAWCWKWMKRGFTFAFGVIRDLRLIPKAALIIAAILLVEFLWIRNGYRHMEMLLLGWLVERTVLVLLTAYVLLCMGKLLIAGKEISSGNLDYHVDTAKMLPPMKEHGEQLNQISEGINKAVAERMRSERFKTELITNVSHDIKTPLTSIINYVDLLEKEEIPGEKAKEYIDVLSRQSAKLKKLIEDLMEASKASTGNIAVNMERCELNVLLDQCAGEYAEKLKAANLELLVEKPQEPVTIMADGRHMWRIFDNLLSNICKYALPGTRVYLNLEKQDRKATVTFRNISANRLSMGEEELLERFARGDSSRNTDGSGLGLNIANSLVLLQKGEMHLAVDGDLFKVTLKFDTIE